MDTTTEKTTDRMRHVPPGHEVRARMELFRERIEQAIASIEGAELTGEQRAALDERLSAVAHWLERMTELARRKPVVSPRPGTSAVARVRASLQSALEAAGQLEGSDFGRRAPSHQFEQSGSELVWQSTLAAGYSIALLFEEAARFDPDLWFRQLSREAGLAE